MKNDGEIITSFFQGSSIYKDELIFELIDIFNLGKEIQPIIFLFQYLKKKILKKKNPLQKLVTLIFMVRMF